MFEEKEIGLTPVSQLGEFGLIQRLTEKFLPRHGFVHLGPGDDCAVWEKNEMEYNLISTDTMAEGIHFDLAYVPLKHLGAKAISTNVSDICAMNGTAWGVTISIAASNRFSVEALDDLYEGIHFACEKYNITLLGGDLTSRHTGLVITVTVLGSVLKSQCSFRSGAKVNDIICVTGDLGAAYAGLKVLQREKEVFKQNPEIQPDLGEFTYCVGRQLSPVARVDIIHALAEHKIVPTAMIDVSDGISGDLLHICKRSQLGCSIYQEKLPVDVETGKIAEDFGHSSFTYALNGGEDYELLFTVPLADYSIIKNIPEIFLIGHMTDTGSGCHIVTNAGQQVELNSGAWNHFV
jgi:thiamine-monophosphate kinase